MHFKVGYEFIFHIIFSAGLFEVSFFWRIFGSMRIIDGCTNLFLNVNVSVLEIYFKVGVKNLDLK